MPATELFPEDVLIATLHLVGSKVRLVDDERLARIFDKAAKESTLFARFRQHPLYLYSKVLSDGLQTLDLGGAIVRDNAPLQYFRVSEHVAGDYGKAKIALLAPADAKIVEKIARQIRAAFGEE